MIKRFGVKTSSAELVRVMSKVLMCDPPSGHRYGFPKPFPTVLTEEIKDTIDWLLKEGYPQAEIDSWGDHFYCRYYETEVDDE